MPDVVKHAWTHRPRAQGGTDPINVDPPWGRFDIGTTNVTAGQNSSSDHVGIPFHDDESPQALVSGGVELTADGGIVLPSRGLYDIQVEATFAGSGWTSNNFSLNTYFVLNGQTLDGVLGSQTLGGETLEHSMSHSGAGMTNTTDRRKPEMEQRRLFVNSEAFGDSSQPVTIYPTYYSFTSSLTTLWTLFQCYVVRLSSDHGAFL